MKRIKVVGLVAVAAMALTALVGASPALSATTSLCQATDSSCAAEHTYAEGTKYIAKLTTGTSARLTFGPNSIQCSNSTIEGTYTKTHNEPAQATISAFSFGSCTLNGSSSCAHFESVFPEASLSAEGGGNGSLSVSSPPSLHICGEPTGCSFPGKSLHGSVTGGAPAQIAVEGEFGNYDGCGNYYTIHLTGNYTNFIGEVQPEMVSLCRVQVFPCEAHYPTGSEISAALKSGTQLALKGVGGNELRCTQSALAGELTEAPAVEAVKASISSASWSGCTRWVKGVEKGGCEVTTNLKSPWAMTVEKGEAGNGTMWLAPSLSMKNCGFFTLCTFKGAESGERTKLAFAGGEPATATATNAAMTSALCGTGEWSATYQLEPGPMFVGSAARSPFYLTN